jgi:ABC-type transporter Mla subunit MlaD
VASANANVSALLANGAVATGQLNSLLQADTPSTAGVINGLSDTAGLANARQGALQAFFQILPVVSQDAALTVDAATGQARFQVTVNSENTVCPYTSQMAEPTSLVSTLDLTRNCASSAPDLLQRGAATAPTPSGGTP